MKLCGDRNPDSYVCTLAAGHAGDYHEARKATGRAHAWGLGAVVARWPRVPTFEEQCQATLDADDRDAYEAVQRGDAAPEEVEARRKQMRVLR